MLVDHSHICVARVINSKLICYPCFYDFEFQNDLKSQVGEGSLKLDASTDILSKAIQKPPNGSRVQGMGQFITPSMCFNVPNHSLLSKERKLYQENFELVTTQLEFMNARLNAYSKTEVGSSNFPKPKHSVDMEDSFGNLEKVKVS